MTLSAVSIFGLSSSPSSVHAQSPQSNQNGNTTVTILNNNNNHNNVTADDIKQHLHMLPDGTIVAAQNNDTFGILWGLDRSLKD